MSNRLDEVSSPLRDLKRGERRKVKIYSLPGEPANTHKMVHAIGKLKRATSEDIKMRKLELEHALMRA